MGGVSALVCAFHYLLHLSSYTLMPFLPFLPCLIPLCVSYVHAYPLWHERRGLLGLYYFLLFPCGLGHWLGKSPYLSSLLGFYSCYFSSYYAYEPAGYHSCHVGPLGLLPFFLGFSGPFTLLLPLCCAYGSVGRHSCHIDPLGLLSLSLDFPSLFTLLLPLVVPIGPLAIIPDILAHWANYLFPWASLTHLFYFTSCYAYGPAGCHSCHIGLLGLWSLFLGFPSSFTLLLPLVVPMGLLAIIPIILAHWAYYLFPWAFPAHLLYFYLFCFLALSSFLVVGLFLPLGLLSENGYQHFLTNPFLKKKKTLFN